MLLQSMIIKINTSFSIFMGMVYLPLPAICMVALMHLKWRHTQSLVRWEQCVSPFIKCLDVV